MDRERIIGFTAGMLSEICGFLYMILYFVDSGVGGATIATLVQTLIQLALVITMIVGFFNDQKKLLYGAALISMSYNGVSYLVDDVEVTFPLDHLFDHEPKVYAAALLIYFLVDFFWVLALLFVLQSSLNNGNKMGERHAIGIFLSDSVVLLANAILFAIGYSKGSGDYLSIIGCLGDAFCLVLYAVALNHSLGDVVKDGAKLEETKSPENDGEKTPLE